MILVIPGLFNWFTAKGVNALAIFPFIIVKHRDSIKNPVTMNHEKIHWRQQVETLIIPFYLAYISTYVYYRLRGYDHLSAYFMIPFEKEAYRHEANPDYLGSRRLWAWLPK